MKRFDNNNYEFNTKNKIGIYLIHGFTSTTYELKVLATFLKNKNYHVVLNNLPGHGTTVEDCNNSKYQDWFDYSKIEFAKLCSQSDSVFIVGCSMGGVIGLYLASLFPICGLIIGGTVLQFKLHFNTYYLNTVLCHFIKTRKKKLTFPKEIRDSIDFYGYQEYPLKALNEFRKMNKIVRKNLYKITAPTFIIHSNSDQVSIRKNVDIVYAGIKSKVKQILEVENASHNVFDTNQDMELIFHQILKFLEKNKH